MEENELMAPVLFMPWEKKIEPDGQLNVLQLARRLDIPLESTCGGNKICGKCKIIVEESENTLPPPSDREREILGPLIQKGYRLACHTVLGDGAVIRIPEESVSVRQIILTSGTQQPYSVRIRPKVAHYFLEVPAPVLDPVVGDSERLQLSLTQTYGLKKTDLDPVLLRKLPRVLHKDHKGATATLWGGREIIDLYPGKKDRLLGMAFDIGSTTVVGYLMDLVNGKKLSVKSAVNPQIPFGDDVISRISFCQADPIGLERLRSSIVHCLNELILEAASEIGADLSDVVDMTAVGNTVMHHLLLGLDPRYLSMAPYAPVLQEAQDIKSRDLGIRIAEGAYVHLPPLKAGFVGSDAVAGILATGMHKSRVKSLFIDLGTNGEIVLGDRNGLICCSAAAGPAFEGGHMRWGMRAATGAIERVKIDPVTYDVTVKTIHGHQPVGLCGSGVISAVAEMIRIGILQARGNFNGEIPCRRLREGADGLEFVLVWARESGTAQDIVLTQKDVSELQMAKSAVRAGATLLMESIGIQRVERILLAGACGNYVDPMDACTIGLFPGHREARITGVGNAAGDGACMALLDRYKRKDAWRIARDVQYRELAAMARFQELFISGMFFTEAIDYRDEF
jgi:uncharacterized 2Fe-2S/4Fe-4S cluster protein (DUF4445 family)